MYLRQAEKEHILNGPHGEVVIDQRVYMLCER